MEKTINFECSRCSYIFDIDMKNIIMDQYRELHFTPEPVCPCCGAMDDIYLSDYGQEQIDHMLLSQELRPREW